MSGRGRDSVHFDGTRWSGRARLAQTTSVGGVPSEELGWMSATAEGSGTRSERRRGGSTGVVWQSARPEGQVTPGGGAVEDGKLLRWSARTDILGRRRHATNPRRADRLARSGSGATTCGGATKWRSTAARGSNRRRRRRALLRRQERRTRDRAVGTGCDSFDGTTVHPEPRESGTSVWLRSI